MPDHPPRFDPRPIRAALSAAERDRIVDVALGLAYTEIAALHTGGPQAVGFEAAEHALQAVLRDALPAIALSVSAPFPLPDLSIFGIRACRVCGCTDAVACPEGCSWVGDDLCSACDRKIGGLRPW